MKARHIRVIFFSAFLVGTLDIAAAIALSLLSGANPLTMLRFIASGVFGLEAFTGGWLYSLYGLAFHYFIALIWTLIFFNLSRWIPVTRRYRIASGILFGIVVWLAMNFIVLPLSNTPALPFDFRSAITGGFVLIVAIGIPLGYLSAHFFHQQKTASG